MENNLDFAYVNVSILSLAFIYGELFVVDLQQIVASLFLIAYPLMAWRSRDEWNI